MEFYDLEFCNSIKDVNKTDSIKNDIEILQNKNNEQINILMSYNIKTKVECIKNKNDIKIINYRIIKYIIKHYFNKKEIIYGENKIVENYNQIKNISIFNKEYNKDINLINKKFDKLNISYPLTKKYKYIANYMYNIYNNLQEDIDILWNIYYLNIKKKINEDLVKNKKYITNNQKLFKDNMKIKIKNKSLIIKNANIVNLIEKKIKICISKNKRCNDIRKNSI